MAISKRRKKRRKRIDPFMAAMESASAAQLRYVRDDSPGIRRFKAGGGFAYRDGMGAPVTDKATRARIRALVIPPAWTDVWICVQPNGHLQATGRDARRRKQYRYHPRWRLVRDETKYERLIPFAYSLPTIRKRVEEHLALRGLPREKVLAMIVRLKDFRTWAGTVLAARHLAGCPNGDASAVKAYSVEAIKDVAHKLRNTVAVCRKCYIHPRVLDALIKPDEAPRMKPNGRTPAGLSDEERALAAFLGASPEAAAA